jgi:RNA polymerase sigma-70 factor (ECF subfamily)
MDIETLSDEALMQRVCARDAEAFRVLYCRYEARIFNFALRICGNRALGEDLLQEAFWRVWQGARTFDPSRGDFRRWVYRVALHAARSELSRKRYTRESSLIEDSPEGSWTTNTPASEFQQKETAALVAQALAGLSPTLREVVVLRCVEGLKFSEIAATTHAPVGTLKARFHRAVADIRRRLLPGENQ